ncbi:MAG TPA: succinate dehydrogenase cytochrome b subunit [Solirubrobacterales bacterium]|nr:succinate dehydrogenase cytochrome b subunit [Solirubrobacterales bacterium]
MSQQAPSIGGAVGTSEQPRLRWMREVWESTIGKKVIVAITGAILALYVVLHVLGNLKALQGLGGGTPAVDAYAGWLRTVGGPAIPREGVLWVIRTVLVLALIIHVAGVLELWKRNREARPAGHRDAPVIRRTLAARTMMITGLLLLAFIVFHILHFTTRTIHPTPLGSGTVYSNLYLAFQEWWLVAIYVGAVVLLGFHLYHALWSVTQTAGWDKPNRNPTFRRAAAVIAIGVTVGFAAVPIAFFADVLPEPAGERLAATGGR